MARTETSSSFPSRSVVAIALHFRRWLVLSAVCALGAATILNVIPVVFGTPKPIVQLTWTDLSSVERASLEQRFHLDSPTNVTGNVWEYVPGDTSTETLREIVTSPFVASTDHIDRRALKLASSAPLSPRLGGLVTAPWAARGARLLAYLIALAAVVLLFRPAAACLPAGSPLRLFAESLAADPRSTLATLPSQLPGWLQRGVPVASAEAAAAFRIVFGALTVLLVVTHPVRSEALSLIDVASARGPYGAVLRWASVHPGAVDGLGTWLVVSGLLFVSGTATRVSYPAFVAGFLLWACIFSVNTSHHVVASLGMTQLCLLAARWNDAWSVDAWLGRRWNGARANGSSRRYGFAIWTPRLVLGLTFLAAAVSKLHGGLTWITNGTVRYHFITDFDRALVSWGPVLARYEWVAVAMSAFAVVTEALVITAAFSQSEQYVLALGAAALSLFCGFAIFQGLRWWPWWILLTAFLPWHRLRPSPSAAMQSRRVSPIQWIVVGAIVAQQVAASVLQLEGRPLLSAFDMYSASYGSPEAYEASINLVYHVVVYEDGAARRLADCAVDDRTAVAMSAALAGKAVERASLLSRIEPCLDSVPSATAFSLAGDRRVYVWNEGRFEWKRDLDVIGPVTTEWIRNRLR